MIIIGRYHLKHKYYVLADSYVFIILTLILGSATAETQSKQQDGKGNADIEREKIEQEVLKLRLENERSSSWWGRFLTLAPLITALVALLGVFITLWKQMGEMSRRRSEEMRLREQDSLRRFDHMFTSVVSHLGSESVALQASAAASLPTFLKLRYKEFYDDVFALLVANVKIEHDKVVRDLLVGVFEKAIRLKLKKLRANEEETTPPEDFERNVIDLSRAYLARVDLQNLHFNGIELDVAYADLQGANLIGTTLVRVRGYRTNFAKARLSRADMREARLNRSHCREAIFHGTNLASATFKGADLKGAQFFQARLQSAHLENADLKGAKFKDADLNDTYFYGATLDEGAMIGITRARNWLRAHFDKGVLEKLRALT